MGHVVIGTSVCLRFCFLLTLTGLVIIWTSGMCVSVSRAFGTNRNHVGLYWKCSAGRGWRRRGEWEGGLSMCQNLVREEGISKRQRLRPRNVDYPLENNSSIFNACLQAASFQFCQLHLFPDIKGKLKSPQLVGSSISFLFRYEGVKLEICI